MRAFRSARSLFVFEVKVNASKEKKKMNVEQSLDQQVEVGGGAGLCAPGPRPFGFMLSEFDIPEEQGNVVVLYEVC